MKIAIFGRKFSPEFSESIQYILDKFKEREIYPIIFKPFYEFIKNKTDIKIYGKEIFSKKITDKDNIDLIISIGGDGTFLECVSYVLECNVPIVGFNSGRLGFLANIAINELEEILELLLTKKYTVEERTLIEVESSKPAFSKKKFALNEITVQKRDSGSMIVVHVLLNNEFLNSYRADGLIISTPTGSTAYSLSTGGPIVFPNSKNFILTPIAPHNLTVRPIVISDDSILSLKIESRNKNYLTSLDYHSEILKTEIELTIKKAKDTVKVITFKNKTFVETLRNKLMWGLDKRN